MKLKYWLPAIAWATVIFLFSTGSFSSDSTRSVLENLLKIVFPDLSIQVVMRINHLVRKLSHWAEYFIFALLIYQGFRNQQKKTWRWSWAVLTGCIIISYAFLDELHQLFVPSRSADWRDSMLDTWGGICGLIIIYIRSWKHRGSPIAPQAQKILE
jgi:VanZ family protein